MTFLVTIPVHEGCSESSERAILGSERGSETKTKSSERSSETKDLIIDIIKQDPHITDAEIAIQLNMSSRGVEKQIRKLRELGRIKRTGGRFGGYWEIVILDKNKTDMLLGNKIRSLRRRTRNIAAPSSCILRNRYSHVQQD